MAAIVNAISRPRSAPRRPRKTKSVAKNDQKDSGFKGV